MLSRCGSSLRAIVRDVGTRTPETGQRALWHLAGPLWSIDEPTADDAIRAEQVIEFVQRAYRGKGSFLRHEALALGSNHGLAVRILKQRWGGSNKLAKEAQLRASDGKPLQFASAI
jgi:hypothetical protein